MSCSLLLFLSQGTGSSLYNRRCFHSFHPAHSSSSFMICSQATNKPPAEDFRESGADEGDLADMLRLSLRTLGNLSSVRCSIIVTFLKCKYLPSRRKETGESLSLNRNTPPRSLSTRRLIIYLLFIRLTLYVGTFMGDAFFSTLKTCCSPSPLIIILLFEVNMQDKDHSELQMFPFCSRPRVSTVLSVPSLVYKLSISSSSSCL